ncbi:MAG TPA: NAD-dependent epimerase/dehydratase family protein [Miltoncostaeaceae bacterium]|nr:NAD-dependent epimerase/dehydratase family protein [Miltoncostaeaceae bacterium]
MPERRPRALVTGGAGLIGSHVADLLLAEGWAVRVLDSLEPTTHRGRVPGWIDARVDFRRADIRDVGAVRDALDGVEVVLHQAAYGGYMPEIAKFVSVNSLGTAQLLETIRDERLPVRKVVVASSQAVYREGAGRCAQHGRVFPQGRDPGRLAAGRFAPTCPRCGEDVTPAPTPEDAPGGGDNVYAITKSDQERLTLSWSRQTGIPAVALRYSCTYGPRQSLLNPYTGLIAIFATRLLNGLPPVLFEDGEQTRDLVFVEDVARANLLALTSDALDGRAVNVGTGCGTSVRAIAGLVGEALGIAAEPEVRGEFRPGEMRHLTSDITLARSAGFAPEIALEDGVGRYLDWVRSQGDVAECFEAAARGLRARGIVQGVGRG